MNFSRYSNCLFISLLLWTNVLLAQKVNVKALAEKYPLEPFVYLNRSEKVFISIDDNKLKIISHEHEELLILKNNLSQTRSKKVRTSDFISINKIEASIFVYDGKSHKKIKLKSIELHSENIDNDSFYDNEKYYYITFAEAKEGDIISIDYDVEYKEPLFFGSFYFSDYHPIIHNLVSVEFPINQIKLKLLELNNQYLKIKARVDSTKKTKTLSWITDSTEALTQENLDAGFRSKSSYILMNIEFYSSGRSLVNLGGSLTNLYKWYTRLIKNVDLTIDSSLVKFTDSLVRSETTELDKIKSIYYWVRNKIAYIAYEDGLNGFIPREASVVYKQRFGDCKDMANLVVQMCKIAKLPVYRAWIGTRDIPYQFSEFPAPFCANHMIAAFISHKDTIYLDATGKNHPFNLPTSMIQGKEALIGINDSVYLVSRIPFVNKERSIISDSVILKVSALNNIVGKGYYSVTGYEKIKLQNYLDKGSYDSQKDYLKLILEKGNNKFRLDTFYKFSAMEDSPLIVYYAFTLPEYVSRTENHIYININLSKNMFDKLTLIKRRYPIDISYKSIQELKVTIELNPGEKLDFMPARVISANSPFSFDLDYSARSKSILFKNTIGFNQIRVENKDFASLNTFISEYKKSKSQLISITYKN